MQPVDLQHGGRFKGGEQCGGYGGHEIYPACKSANDRAKGRCIHFVTRCFTQRFCDVSWMCSRLKAPFRPSATDFEGSK
ncbi:hypothetical protein CU668_11990 [Pseudomonas syringae pv. actinidifoliorum]|nr:hypothetical protein [Pseudomonas syringae pv. actinidifoliorum]